MREGRPSFALLIGTCNLVWAIDVTIIDATYISAQIGFIKSQDMHETGAGKMGDVIEIINLMSSEFFRWSTVVTLMGG